jgi:predicted RNase H-like nuclease (RuvC/YqgF family)
MSPIGKVFLLVNFLLAGCFLAWASTSLATNAEWKTKYDDKVAELAETKATLAAEASDLSNQLGMERNAKESRTAERDQAKAESDRNKEDLDAEKRANEQLRADIASIKETLDNYNQTIQQLQASKDAAVAEARDLERQRDTASDAQVAAETAQRDAEDATRRAEANIASLEAALNGSKQEVSKLDAELQTLIAATGATVASITAQPDITGAVLQVDTSLAPGLVALNVGSNDQVTRGMTFQIFNGPTYKGDVRIENVHDNMSSALIMGTVDGTTIGQGDSAATNL